MATESQKRAKKKYKAKCRELRITLYPTDQDIAERLACVDSYSTYIKELIRRDIKK